MLTMSNEYSRPSQCKRTKIQAVFQIARHGPKISLRFSPKKLLQIQQFAQNHRPVLEPTISANCQYTSHYQRELVYTFNINSGLGPIIAYQILYGIGTEISVQIPIVVAGALSSTEDRLVPTATVLVRANIFRILTANSLTYSQPSDRLHGFN